MTRVAFGEFVLDSDTRQLLRAGQAVHLSPLAFQLLEALVASRPKALSKDELQARLWPDSFVVEANLANLVVGIRAALGDDPRNPRYVRTVQRFGYAFRADDDVAGLRAAPARDVFRLTWKGGRAVLVTGAHTLGRDPALDLSFDSTTVSRRHARIVIEAEAAAIEDLGSKNGTFVNDRRVDTLTPLADGDVIRLGSFRLKLRRTAPAAPTQTATAAR